MKTEITEKISVLMPTYNQGEFISRAITSLILQNHEEWELIIVNDGSTDDTDDIVKEYIETDVRIRYVKNKTNLGLGASLNIALDLSTSRYIAYLPSDDIFFRDHLSSLMSMIANTDEAVLVYSGVKFFHLDSALSSVYMQSSGQIDGYPLQLVQVLHKKLALKWVERSELVTDDLNIMYWSKIAELGSFCKTENVSCEWVDHPFQRHKIIDESHGGGIYRYRKMYEVKQPLRYKSSSGIYINEIEEYKQFHSTMEKVSQPSGLKILLVGELAYNPERIYAFEEAGCKLYGLWISAPNSYNTIGPLQFGNVEDISGENWIENIQAINPDIIYALLNFQAVNLAHTVLFSGLDIPFVWHFKEGPFYCRQQGRWKQLVELYVYSDGQIYTNEESKDWFQQFIDKSEQLAITLDGDLPKKDWFKGLVSSKISSTDGEIHTVIPGRPMGLTPKNIGELAKRKIHLHLYGDVQQALWTRWIEEALVQGEGFIHLHSHCAAKDWVTEFSKYDAGWLHCFKSENYGELMRASWLDLNYPARIPTLAAAGLPMIHLNNAGHIAASYTLIENKKMGISFSNFDELADKLYDKQLMKSISENVWNNRMDFTFDSHIDDLLSFFKKVILTKKQQSIQG